MRFVCFYFLLQLANYEDDFKSERAEKMKASSDREKITRERDYIHEELKKEEQHLALGESMKQVSVRSLEVLTFNLPLLFDGHKNSDAVVCVVVRVFQ